jgi:hypothetical protein
VVVVSEETGLISLAVAGRLEIGLTSDKLRERLQALMNAPAAAAAAAPEPEPVLERIPRG